jgi:DNA-binding transcriptional LysR family regulator
MNVELRHLKLIDAVARAGSINAAARELSKGAPAVSRQLARLEALLGAALFDRSVTGTHLTPAGERVARQVRTILRSVEDLSSAAAEADPPVPARAPVVRIAGPVLAATATYWSRMGYAVSAVETAEPRSYQLLQRGDVDVTLAHELLDGAVTDLSGGCRLLGRTELLHAALPPGHHLAGGGPLALAALDGEPWVLPETGTIRKAALAACDEAGFRPAPLMVGPAAAVLGAVAHGAAVTLCPPSWCRPRGGEPLLVRLREQVPVRLLLLWRPGLAPSDLIQGTLDSL